MKTPCQDEKKCTGCMACFNVCPNHSIQIIEKKDGFLYPKIDIDKCLNCSLCSNVCSHEIKTVSLKLAYAAYAKDEKLRLESSSGGLFSIIANYILERNGVVYGAVFDTDYTVKHNRCDKKEDLSKLRGAKYLQSFIGDIFKDVLSQLNKNKLVYFVGTPCQVAGLKKFLRKDFSNLYCSDLICHGVPSPKVWKKYLNEITENPNYVSFRDKRYGWTKYCLSIIDEHNSEHILNREKNIYMKGFIDNYFLRESCYDCQYKGLNRPGDITLADFWGLEKVIENFDLDDQGTSLLLVNSKKGKQLIEQLNDEIVIQEVDIMSALKFNQSALKSSYYPIQRERFINLIEKESYEDTLKMCEKLTFKERILLKIKK